MMGPVGSISMPAVQAVVLLLSMHFPDWPPSNFDPSALRLQGRVTTVNTNPPTTSLARTTTSPAQTTTSLAPPQTSAMTTLAACPSREVALQTRTTDATRRCKRAMSTFHHERGLAWPAWRACSRHLNFTSSQVFTSANGIGQRTYIMGGCPVTL